MPQIHPQNPNESSYKLCCKQVWCIKCPKNYRRSYFVEGTFSKYKISIDTLSKKANGKDVAIFITRKEE